MRKYLEILIFCGLFIIISHCIYTMRNNNSDELVVCLISIIFGVVVTIVLCWLLSFLNYSTPKDYSSCTWLSNISIKTKYFRYKNSWYTTYLNDNNRIKVHKVVFMRFIECGTMHNYDERESYRRNLINILDIYIKKDISHKLFVRSTRNKFKDYNSNLG